MMWLLTLWGGVKRLFGLAVAYPWQAALVAALLACGFFYGALQQSRANLADEQAAHIATKVGYANAQKVAADMNRKQVERIAAEYTQIGINAENEYEKRLADNRAALDRWMRTQATKGLAGRVGTSEAATVSGETMPDATEALVPVSDLEIAADNYSQLVSLIEWAKAVGKVE